MECFCFNALLRSCVFLHFSLISGKPSLNWTSSKADTLFWSYSCTLIVQFQQGSNCSKSAVNNRKRCEICSSLTIKLHQNNIIYIVLVSLLLNLNIFHNFFYCFYRWLWRPHHICLEPISIGKRLKYFEASGFPCCILNNTLFFETDHENQKNFMMSGKLRTSAKKMVYPEGTFLW